MKNILYAQIALLIAAVVIIAILVTERSSSRPITGSSPVVAGQHDQASILAQLNAFSLINPAVIADLGEHFITNLTPLKQSLLALQVGEKAKTDVYFLYLNNSRWIGLNERDPFVAASTVKVPLAMSIYKLSEEGRIDLDDVYALQASDLDSNFGTLYQAGVGATSTVRQLLALMLTQSDNTATHALVHVAQSAGLDNAFADVYAAVGWPAPTSGSEPSYVDIDAKTLANMFIALYNAAYDNITDSQTILADLDESPFNDALASIPTTVPVAHKIGMDAPSQTYSDCGVILVPNRPYVLCVAVQGAPLQEANSFMSAVSHTVYSYITNN